MGTEARPVAAPGKLQPQRDIAMSNELIHPTPQQSMAVANPASDLVSGVMRAAADPNVDADKMERLWAIAKEAQANQARREYADAMSAVQAELPKIIRDRENKQTNSYYATLDNIIRQISPVYARHGFSLTFGTEDSPEPKCIRIVCKVMHAGGHSEEVRYDQPIDDVGIQGSVNKTQVHARGSAVTYGRRYLTLMVFNLNTGFDDDGNAAQNGGKPVTDVDVAFIERAKTCQHPEQAAELRREVIQHYKSSSKVPPVVMAAINEARDATRPRD